MENDSACPADGGPSSHELLAHALPLRRLAARLVGPAEADEVVHDAFAAALRSPPEMPRALGGWLRVVVSNLARNRRRGNARRIQREREVARPERDDACGGAQRRLERVEVQRRLYELIAALPKEQRAVLHLRYFEGESVRAIAARLGASVKAIESRHTRALASLRARLEERHGDDREGWLSGLLPWLLRAVGAPGPVSAWIVMLVLALVGASGAAWQRSLSAGPPAGATSAVDSERAPPSQATQEQALAQREEPLESTVVSALARVLGRVRRLEDGASVSAITVQARTSRGELLEITTDERGTFEFSRPGGLSLASLTACAGPTTAARCDPRELTVEAGVTEELVLYVSEGATLSGVVVDERGSPVANAVVLARSGGPDVEPQPQPERQAVTRLDGSFTLAHVGESFSLVAEASGAACLTGLHGRIAGGEIVEGLELVLAEARSFRGRIVDAFGHPVPRATLRFEGGESTSTKDQTGVPGLNRYDAARLFGECDAEGRYSVGPFPRDDCSVKVESPGYAPGSFTLRAGIEDKLVLFPGRSLAGVVLDRGGGPLDGARLLLGGESPLEARSGRDGSFEFRGVVASPAVYLHISRPGYAMRLLEAAELFDGNAALEVRLDAELVLAGRLVDPRGQPLAGVDIGIEGERRVTVEPPRTRGRMTWERAGGMQGTRTDDGGHFRLDGLYPGEFDLDVAPAVDQWLERPFRVRAGQEDLELVLDPERYRVGFSGRVLDAQTGLPIKAFTLNILVARGGGWEGRNRQVMDPAGRFQAIGFASAPCVLSIAAAGYGSRLLPECAPGANDVVQDVFLHPWCLVEFLLPPDSAQPSVEIQFRTSGGDSVWGEAGGFDLRSAEVDRGCGLRVTLPRAALLMDVLEAGEPYTLGLDTTLPRSGPVVLQRPNPSAYDGGR